MDNSREQKLSTFVQWAADHIRGDEKGEAQIFLDHLFAAFGQRGSLDVGGTAEMRIRKASEDGGGTSFADYVWKPIVLIEMKKRGADLSRHYRQAFDYWVRLVPDRPQYVVLCNFDEFWIYDFNTQLDSPKDKVKLAELATRWGPLAFLFPTNEVPKFGNDREAVTREAADKLALCFKKLITRRVDRGLAQRFILQTLVALFAEDIGLLPRYLYGSLVEECRTPADSFDLIGGLFDAMNTDQPRTGGRYKGVRYFNGGIFREPAHVELHEDELNQLRVGPERDRGAAGSDWSKVSPEIFGAIFQDSMEAEERHAFGAHYTSPVDIMKIVKPTISDPWTSAIESAKDGKTLNELLHRLATLRVLDPACGSGNFLYLAYREMKRLEMKIRDRLNIEFPKSPINFENVTARQFFGMDINSFAIELAKVSMMIGRKLAIDELHIADEKDLPLDNLDANFKAADALLTQTDSGEGAIRTPWAPADVIIGNPPYLGASLIEPQRGRKYVDNLRRLYPDIPGMADYCVYWFRRAQDHLPPLEQQNPFVGRAGLVGTQSIRFNQSRLGALDHITASATIVEAVDNQPWSGDAGVNVSIVNWANTTNKSLLPKSRRLWFVVSKPTGRARKKANGSAANAYQLDYVDLPTITAALSQQHDLGDARTLAANENPQRAFRGQESGNRGFILTPQARAELLRRDPKSEPVIYPHLIGRDLLTGDGCPTRWIIDFRDRDQMAASAYEGAFAHLKTRVLSEMEEVAAGDKKAATAGIKRRKPRLGSWWLLRRACLDTITAIEGLCRYIVCARHMLRPVFCFMASAVHPDSAIQVFAFEDDYSFGILQSGTHAKWFTARGSKLTARHRYTPESVFDTFPWPQSPTKKQIDAVASAAVEVRRVRAEALKITDGGLRAVYRTLELPGKHPLKDAHAALDAAVLAAYGFDAKKDLLAQLLELNLAVAAREKTGQPVTAPGVPASYGDTAKLVSADCIKP